MVCDVQSPILKEIWSSEGTSSPQTPEGGSAQELDEERKFQFLFSNLCFSLSALNTCLHNLSRSIEN